MFDRFRKKKKENEVRNFLIEQLQTLKKNNIDLKRLYEDSKNYSINKSIKEVCRTSDRILETCIKDNSKISKINLLVNYYQVEIVRILSQYISIKKNKIDSAEAKEFIIKVEDFIKNVSKAFEKILEELIIDNKNGIDADIKIMLKDLEDKNLIGEKHD